MKSLILSGLLLASSSLMCVEANAQVFSSQRSQTTQTQATPGTDPSAAPTQNTVRGTAALRTTLEQSETLYLNKDKTYNYDLVLRSPADVGGQRLPVGAIVRGQFEPAEGGLVYMANSVEVADRIYRLEAASELLRDRKDPRQTTTGAILTDAAIGAAGGYVLGEVFGDAGVWEVVGGAAAGAVIGNTTAPFAVVIRPEDEIVLYSN